MRIVLDENKCSSLGMCEATAPEFFEVGEDGGLTILNPTPPDSERALIEEAGGRVGAYPGPSGLVAGGAVVGAAPGIYDPLVALVQG